MKVVEEARPRHGFVRLQNRVILIDTTDIAFGK